MNSAAATDPASVQAAGLADSPPDESAASRKTAPDVHADATGRQRIVRNVLSSWGGHFVSIVAGFVLPRMIDDRLGQARLGVWDFSWSFIAYFGLVQGGIVSSINRYVARFRANNDIAGINRVVSSVNCVLWLMAIATVLLAAGTALLIPVFWGERLGAFAQDGQWAVLLLGVGLALEIGSAGFAGVVTGCHRWDIHNGVYACTCFISTSLMIVAVLTGGGLPSLAIAYVTGEFIGRMARVFLAYRVCPGLHVSFARADWSTAREMIHFGGKSFVPQMADILLNQTISMLIVSNLGAPALAIFTRPRSLVRHVITLVSKLAYVVIPTASSLQAVSREEELRELFIRSTRYGAYVALPMIITLAVLADLILAVWMGPEYVYGKLLATLAIGSLASITQQPIISILSGLNAHGRAGVANLVASICAVLAALVTVGWLGYGLLAAALSIAIPLTIVNGFYVPMLACHKLDLRYSRYIREIWLGPALCCLPYVACLLVARWAFVGHPAYALCSGLAAGLPILAMLYWNYVAPASIKTAIRRKLGFRGIPVELVAGDTAAETCVKPSICIVAHNSFGAMTGGTNGRVGGVEWQTSLTARWFASRGYAVSLLTWDESDGRTIEIDGVRIIPVCRRDAGIPILRFFHPRWTGLNRAMKQAHADIYYQNCGEYVTGQVALWCRKFGRKFVYSVASDPDCDARLPEMRSLRERVLYRFGLRNADCIIVQTRKQQDMLRTGFGLGSLVIPMPCPGPADAEYLEPLPPHDRPPRVLWVGRILPLKRLEWLLHIAQSLPNIHFDVVGPPDPETDYTRALQKRAAGISNVTLHGRVNRQDMPAMYRRAFCLCCTSEFEGFPNTFLEAWSHGLPVVSTVDPDNLLRERGLGIAASSVAELCEAIQRLGESPQTYLAISRSARRFYADNHAVEKVMPRFETTFLNFSRSPRDDGSASLDTPKPTTPLVSPAG